MQFYQTILSNLKDEQLPKLRRNFQDLEDMFAKRIGPDNIADGSLTAALIADGTLTPAKISGTPQAASGTYTGDDVANRTITLGFTPRFVLVVRQSNGTEFTGLSDGTTAFTAYWRLAAGTQSSGVTDWQGIVTNGFKCGSNAASTSNATGVVYWYVAWR